MFPFCESFSGKCPKCFKYFVNISVAIDGFLWQNWGTLLSIHHSPHTQHINTKTVAWHRSNVTLNIATGLERSFCPCFTEYRQI